MNHSMVGIGATIVALIATAAQAADVGFGIRESQIQYTWLYGSTGDVRQGGGSENPSRPLLSDGAGMVGGRTDEGINHLEENWSATASWKLTHGYKVLGTRDDVTAILGSGYSNVSNFVSGPAYTDITASPNMLTLEFTVGGDAGSITSFILRTVLNTSGPLTDSVVRVDQLTPLGWTAAAIRGASGGNSAGLVFQQLDLGPGLYRVQANAYARMVLGQQGSPVASFQYGLHKVGESEPELLDPEYIPEPGSASLLAFGALGMLRRRNR